MREGGRDAAVRLDWTGFLALSVAIVCLQLMVDRGERLGWLESGEFVVYACLAALSFYVFLAHTLTAEAPFLNPSLFTDRNYTIGLVLVFVYGMLNFTPITLLPPMLQTLKGYPDSLIRGSARHAGGSAWWSGSSSRAAWAASTPGSPSPWAPCSPGRAA